MGMPCQRESLHFAVPGSGTLAWSMGRWHRFQRSPVGDDQVRVEVDGVTETLAARARAEGIVEAKQSWFRLAVGAMAVGTLEGGGEAQRLRAADSSRGAVRNDDFTGFAVTGLDGVDDARTESALRPSRSASTKMGAVWWFGEVELEQRFGRGKFDDVALQWVGVGLQQAVVPTPTEFNQTFAQGVGRVERTACIRRISCADFFAASFGFGSRCGLFGEPRRGPACVSKMTSGGARWGTALNSRAFASAMTRAAISSTVSRLTMPPQ